MRTAVYREHLVHKLYESCLSAEHAPFEVLGRELLSGLEAVAVSIWSEHPRVPGALSRMVYEQNLKQGDLPQEDYAAARRVQAEEELIRATVTLKGRRRLSFCALPLRGRKAQFYLVFWALEPFTDEEAHTLSELAERLCTLLDLVLSSDLFQVQRVSHELQAAQFLQRQLMPRIESLQEVSSLAYRALPVHELGGDYLDVLRFPNGTLGLTVADAMGSGVPAAFVMLMARTIFRLITNVTTTPSTVLHELNNHFISEIADVNTFVTQFYAVFDPASRRLDYANAGHNPPVLLKRETGQTAFLPGKGVALGGLGDSEYAQRSVQLDQGDILVIYTDGLKEARDGQNSSFGLAGISKALLRYKEYSAEGICDGLIHSVLRHCSVQADDLSFLVLKV